MILLPEKEGPILVDRGIEAAGWLVHSWQEPGENPVADELWFWACSIPSVLVVDLLTETKGTGKDVDFFE